MSLVDSIRRAKDTVGEAFDQLVSDVEADEAGTGTEIPTEPPTVEKITVTYSDGSSADFAPPSAGVEDGTEDGTEVKDLTDDAPKSDGEKPQAPPVDQTPPGNAEQV